MSLSRLVRKAATGLVNRGLPSFSFVPRSASTAAALSISPSPRCLFDAPVRVQVSGLAPLQEVTLRASLTDEGGELFQSSARYRAESNGELDLSRSPALGGSYSGVEPMGWLWALTPSKPFKRLVKRDVLSPFCLQLEVFEGHGAPGKLLCKGTNERSFLREGASRIPVREGRVRATLFLPPGAGPFPGIIDISGTGGGLPEYKASLLASHGFAALALAYYGYEDLPKDMKEFHLEYFEEAVNYMLKHPQYLLLRKMPVSEKTETSSSFIRYNLPLCTGVDELSADDLRPRKISRSLLDLHKPQTKPKSTLLASQQNIVKILPSDLRFSLDVVRLKSFPSLPYKKWDAKGIYSSSHISPNFKHKRDIPKNQPKIDPPKHQPCHMKHAVPYRKQSAIKYFPNLGDSMFKTSMSDSHTSTSSFSVSSPSDADTEAPDSRTFLTQLPEASSALTKKHRERRPEINTQKPPDQHSVWYEEVLKKLTRNTAQWIVNHQMGRCATRTQLRKRYPLKHMMDLVSDATMTESDFKIGSEKELPVVKDKTSLVEEIKPETPLQIYYQGLSKYWERMTYEDPSNKNKTVEELPMKHFKLSPPIKLQDMMNPRAGKFIYTTDNSFERELYSGIGKIVYRRDATKDIITMSSHNEYIKHLQECFPMSCEQWDFRETQKGSDLKPVKGALRWTALPTPVDTLIDVNLKPSVPKIMKEEELKEMSMIVTPPEHLHIVWNMVKDWKKAWFLNDRKNLPSVQDVPQDLKPLIVASLKDINPRVRMAAAVCHYALQLENDEARDIMLDAILHGNDADSWAAAQCLATEGNATSPVVKRILKQLFYVREESRREQACILLSHISKGTRLVHILLAHIMNSSNWRKRILACQAVSYLHGNVSQDFKHKLTYLMWKDWNSDVRQAAAKALGSLGLGKEVHDHMRDMLETGDSWEKTEALSMIAQLKLMTAKLLPSFLQCFSDDFTAVRIEACITAAVLQLKDEMVQKTLIQLMWQDGVWKVRAMAIKSMSQIGPTNPQFKEFLLWAVHREQDYRVRIQVCRTIVSLQLQDPEIQTALQESLILELHPLVKKELSQTLEVLSIVPLENELSKMVQTKVSMLCQKDKVIARVMKLEEIIEAGREQPKRILFKEQDIKDKIEGYKDLAGLLDTAFADKSDTDLTSSSKWTNKTELEKLLESPSRHLTQEIQESPKAQDVYKKLFIGGQSIFRRKGKWSGLPLKARKQHYRPHSAE
uniref:HEAT repeat-containing protein 4 isoform X2 n=1 Tax=Geotrypetes seraphini TaxID=260995 RepID=A0A6P8RPW7_GEOSA|nr:HEAT repeat-containing protein 4 isoform X2 [Geotrypetes seraphini]